MEGREFLKDSAKLSALAGFGLGGFVVSASKGEAEGRYDPIPDEPPTSHIGRPVCVASISFRMGKSLEQISELVAQEGARGADIIVLPETFRGQVDNGSEEPLDGATVTTLAGLAKKHQTYLAFPIDRKDGNRRSNSVVLLDRKGQVVCVYNKIYPWIREFEDTPTLAPGQQVPVHQADFGRVGFATCFDINFPEVWQRLADQGAELVIWPSDYSGGKLLQAHAMDFYYYVVSCTGCECVVCDIDGAELLYQKSSQINVSRITLDLDRGIYCTDAPVDPVRGALILPSNAQRRKNLLKEHGGDAVMEKDLGREE